MPRYDSSTIVYYTLSRPPPPRRVCVRACRVVRVATCQCWTLTYVEMPASCRPSPRPAGAKTRAPRAARRPHRGHGCDSAFRWRALPQPAHESDGSSARCRRSRCGRRRSRGRRPVRPSELMAQRTRLSQRTRCLLSQRTRLSQVVPAHQLSQPHSAVPTSLGCRRPNLTWLSASPPHLLPASLSSLTPMALATVCMSLSPRPQRLSSTISDFFIFEASWIV